MSGGGVLALREDSIRRDDHPFISQLETVALLFFVFKMKEFLKKDETSFPKYVQLIWNSCKMADTRRK